MLGLESRLATFSFRPWTPLQKICARTPETIVLKFLFSHGVCYGVCVAMRINSHRRAVRRIASSDAEALIKKIRGQEPHVGAQSKMIAIKRQQFGERSSERRATAKQQKKITLPSFVLLIVCSIRRKRAQQNHSECRKRSQRGPSSRLAPALYNTPPSTLRFDWARANERFEKHEETKVVR
jgi:hypothetical protein